MTYKDQGGGSFSGTHDEGYPTLHAYGTATALKGASKTGYTFGGWFAASACTGTALTSLAADGYTANITLYAKWTANTYTVAFNPNTGSGIMGDLSVTYDGVETLTFNAFTKTGYRFNGWDTVATGGGDVRTDGAAASNLATAGQVTLYAQWAPAVVTITETVDGVSGGSGSEVTLHGSGIAGERVGGTITFTAVPDGTHDVYVGGADSGVDVTVDGGADATAGLQYFTVTFDKNGRGDYSAVLTFLKGSTAAAPAEQPTAAGYRFVGWYAGPGESAASWAPGAVNEKATVYARWTAITYIVSFNTGTGGPTAPASASIAYGGTYGSLPMVSRDGFTFDGWFKVGASTAVVATDSVSETHTLFAHWTAINYTVTYFGGGSTGGEVPVQSDCATGSTVTVLGNTNGLVRIGYTFAGWTGDNSIGDKSVGGTFIMPAANVTLTARWTTVDPASSPPPGGDDRPAGSPDTPIILVDDVTHDVPAVFYTIGSGDPEMGTVSNNGTFKSGTRIAVEAVPAEGYAFVGWSDGSTDPIRTITLVTDVTAIFEPVAPTAGSGPAMDVYVYDFVRIVLLLLLVFGALYIVWRKMRGDDETV